VLPWKRNKQPKFSILKKFDLTPNIATTISHLYQKLHQACPDWHGLFFSGPVDQSAVQIIEKGADIYVNRSGMMVTGFIRHCRREGLSSSPGVTLVFFSSPTSTHPKSYQVRTYSEFNFSSGKQCFPGKGTNNQNFQS
jgi:hypothetical protein